MKRKHAGQELKVSQKQGRGISEEKVGGGWERFVICAGAPRTSE